MMILVWGAGLYLTYANRQGVIDSLPLKRLEEIHRMDQQFWRYHRKEIDRILQQEKRLFDAVPSAQIGFLTVEKRLKASARSHGMSEVVVDDPNVGKNPNPMPLSVSMKGSVNALLEWLAELEAQMPYVWPRRIRLVLTPPQKNARIEMDMTYRYRSSLEDFRASAGTALQSPGAAADSGRERFQP